ncbi:MAG: corrinoid protein-associated methyltransferase CpaM [Gemmatimonadota bacterium]
MSTYVLMRILESAPRRYDLGIRLLALGRLGKAYRRLASRVELGYRVLDVGCGTGALTLPIALRGATVKGIDVNPEMLEIARRRVSAAGLADCVELAEVGVAELDEEQGGSYDAVASGLCFSELSEDELSYALRQAARILKPGGLLLVADEVRAHSALGRIAQLAIRVPLAALAYIVTQQTTRPIANLPARVSDAGLCVESIRAGPLGGLCELVARKPGGA